ncbi:hypothetical protein PoB_005294200 [Plakobranchus ocellatus]|uniref:Uncharacterized protein n=1 Tax=Plakobranchus ocellatus TaxID=259542 RepID=A0AAV4C500_9GAST|nr:hypothetical protein PoB_005294200 [Plakobranchus ocellatus]
MLETDTGWLRASELAVQSANNTDRFAMIIIYGRYTRYLSPSQDLTDFKPCMGVSQSVRQSRERWHSLKKNGPSAKAIRVACWGQQRKDGKGKKKEEGERGDA